MEARYKWQLSQAEKTHVSTLQQVRSQVESSQLQDKKLQFDLQSFQSRYKALELSSEQKEKAHLSEKARHEKQHEELRLRLGQSAQEHRAALEQLQESKKLEAERSSLIFSQQELEKKLAHAIEAMFKKQTEHARERTETSQEIGNLKQAISERDRSHEQQISGFKEQIREKVHHHLRCSEELQALRHESEQTETRLRSQAQNLSTEIQALKEKYEVRVLSLNSKISEMHTARSQESEAHARRTSEVQKAHLLEISTWKSKLSELQSQAK